MLKLFALNTYFLIGPLLFALCLLFNILAKIPNVLRSNLINILRRPFILHLSLDQHLNFTPNFLHPPYAILNPCPTNSLIFPKLLQHNRFLIKITLGSNFKKMPKINKLIKFSINKIYLSI